MQTLNEADQMARRATHPTSEGTYSFILVLRGLGELSNQAEQDFFEAGCPSL